MAAVPREREPVAGPPYHAAQSFAAHAEVYPRLPPRTNRDPTDESSLSPPSVRCRDGATKTARAVTPEPEEVRLRWEGVRGGDDDAAERGSETEDSVSVIGDGWVGPVTATPPRTPSRSANPSTSPWDLLGRASPEPPPDQPSSSSPSSSSRSLINRASISAAAQFADFGIIRTKSRSPTEKMRVRSGNGPGASGMVAAQVEDMGRGMSELSVGTKSYVSRQKYGSISTATAGQAEVPMSVGYPSTQALPVISNHSSTKSQSSNKSSRGHQWLRPQSSISSLTPLKPAVHQQPHSPINTDYNVLLPLMRTLKGRMEGYVDFRVGASLIWTKGYCFIEPNSGSLMYQKDEHISSGPPTVILPDVRSCQVRTEKDEDGIIDVSTHSFKVVMKLRPLNVQQYEHWLAALLCWGSLHPAGALNKKVKTQAPLFGKPKRRRNSDTVTKRSEVSIIKVGSMKLWRPEKPDESLGHSHSGSNHSSSSKSSSKQKTWPSWQKVSCTLHETGEFRLHREHDSQLTTTIALHELSRCAVQQLDPSILCEDFCIAIYPQYTPMQTGSSTARPVYLSVAESSIGMARMVYEVWFVLLRAFTMPEIYGPANPLSVLPMTPEDPKVGLADSYRIQRTLFLRVMEAKINASNDRESVDCYAEVLLDGEVRAKTMVRTKTHNPFWREDYEFQDLPTGLTDVAVVLKQRDPRHKYKSSAMVAGSNGFGGGIGGVSMPGSRDLVIGRVDVQLDELSGSRSEMEGWLGLKAQIKEGVYERVGELYIKVEMQELIVLMGCEYKDLSTLLHRFETGLSHQLARVITDLRRLAETLLEIFQVSDSASHWIMSLAESEIDGLHRTHDPQLPNTLTDANILFRGNTLLTKALDTHMKRLGGEYLEETLGEHLKRICNEDIHCEVDPTKLEPHDNLQKNWKTLLSITRGIWSDISSHPDKCPLEIRQILQHIRACVRERYSERKDQVSYSSVCGFLFLRFFCPAILNPKLFGLLKDHPGLRAQRTLTLVAKSLQGLANMTTFGVKEPWMSPMNSFLSDHQGELCDFIDAITSLPHPAPPPPSVPPSYKTPTTIRQRLSPPAREGFPSLPYLIDQPRALAALVTMWCKYRTPKEEVGVLREFEIACERIEERVRECVAKAEVAERPGSGLSERWEEVAETATGVVVREGVYRREERGKRGLGGFSGEEEGHVGVGVVVGGGGWGWGVGVIAAAGDLAFGYQNISIFFCTV